MAMQLFTRQTPHATAACSSGALRMLRDLKETLPLELKPGAVSKRPD